MDSRTKPSVGLHRALIRELLPITVLVVVHVALGTSAARRMSMTFDEGIHITGGLSYWDKNDYRLQPENGNWSQRIVALPAWLGGYSRPAYAGPGWQKSDVRSVAEEFFYKVGNDADATLQSGRLMMAIPSALLAVLVYVWSRRLFGVAGGTVSLMLYAFSPTLLANGFLTTSDQFAALFFTAATAAQWGVLQRISPGRLTLASVAIAALLLSKFSGVLMVPITLLLIAVRLYDGRPLTLALPGRMVRGRLGQLGIFALVIVAEVLLVSLIIWGSYGFRFAACAPGDEAIQFEVPWQETQDTLPPAIGRPLQLARDYHLLPEAYLHGLGVTLRTSQLRRGFLAGEYSENGWLLFFPICFAVKTPLALFGTLALAAWACWAMRRSTAADAQPPSWHKRLYALAPLVTLLVVYWGFALNSGFNIGHRHILPTYPPLFILAGAAGMWYSAPRQATGSLSDISPERRARATTTVSIARVLLAVLLATNVAETVWCWPNYLAYFNPLAGGRRQAYRLLVDSSLDWGQSLKSLRGWLDEHDQESVEPVYLSYFGVARPDYYHIAAELLPCKGILRAPRFPRPLTGGVYCVSATMLEQVYSRPHGKWNAEYEQLYQAGRQFLDELATDSPRPPGADAAEAQFAPEIQTAVDLFEELRWARLCACLRAREPDDEVGYSILIYRLSDAEVRAALEDPPCELLAKPE